MFARFPLPSAVLEGALRCEFFEEDERGLRGARLTSEGGTGRQSCPSHRARKCHAHANGVDHHAHLGSIQSSSEVVSTKNARTLCAILARARCAASSRAP